MPPVMIVIAIPAQVERSRKCRVRAYRARCVLSTASPRTAAPLVARATRFRLLARAMVLADGAAARESALPATDPPLVSTAQV